MKTPGLLSCPVAIQVIRVGWRLFTYFNRDDRAVNVKLMGKTDMTSNSITYTFMHSLDALNFVACGN